MKVFAGIALAIVCILAFAKPAAAQTGGSALPVLQARYRVLQSAVRGGDRKRIAAILAPHFAGVDVAGEADGLKALLAGLEYDAAGNGRISMTIASVKERGGIVIVSRRLEITLANPDAIEDERGAEFVAFSIDTWVRSGHTWLLQKSAAQQLAYYVDGEQIARDVPSL
ncbi:MAG TPA: nuclear transport factor 2 family protein [Candidatus Cybelea sp.]|jgi:hypothetical protein|nr:nuclear transport factor 2 family protein [Candidatus Cybelea sp.]